MVHAEAVRGSTGVAPGTLVPRLPHDTVDDGVVVYGGGVVSRQCEMYARACTIPRRCDLVSSSDVRVRLYGDGGRRHAINIYETTHSKVGLDDLYGAGAADVTG